MTHKFTPADYYSASLSRQKDLNHLLKNPNSIIFASYCAGVSIECMFRAYIVKYTYEFDSKHNLEKLYLKSLISQKLNVNEKQKMTIIVKKANQIWNNNLRYTSEKRMKRIIAHKNVKSKFTDVNKYLSNYQSEIFKAVDFIIKTGESKWT
ncbi:hypothetical protein [Psychroserpens jangbogonensis]|uniref:hypothetical protein n=1 Tax=Psychroserpens jangbogonensis TaxID=1484460 RepID=UPI00053F1F32|nr:hypothetical protein [Psychroserpens jangbogonensis]